MGFREKSAWVMTVALLLGALVYFGVVIMASSATASLATPAIPLIALYTIVLIVIAIIGHAVTAALAPKDANAPLDERDRTIAAYASHRSGYVFGTGVIVSLGLYLLSGNGDLLFYCVFASLMLGTLAEYVIQIFLYRTSI